MIRDGDGDGDGDCVVEGMGMGVVSEEDVNNRVGDSTHYPDYTKQKFNL